jgi:hypothetical protein
MNAAPSLRRVLTIASLWILGASLGLAQNTNSGDIRGTVTDPSGALIDGATVTIVNTDTGVTKVLKTNKAGLYDTSSIIVGTYSVTFEKQGFQRFERSSISLQVGVSTVNAALQVGSMTEEVVVNTDLPLLETETGAQQTTLEAKSMQALPNVGQDWENFAILIPGSAGVGGGVNPGQLISANGNLPYSNVLADGASVTLGTSANADVNVFETVQEVQISTSAFSAQYGIGGIIFNQISKGGTSQFHGSAYEYFQSSQFNANSYQFSGTAVKLPSFHYNNFGGSIGGPIAIPHTGLGKRAFFFFDYDQIISHGATNATNDIPTVDVLNGNFNGTQMSPIYDPTTQVIGHDAQGNAYPIRQSFASEYGSNVVPSALFDKVASNFKNFFPTPTNHIAGGQFLPGTGIDGQGINHKNFNAQVPQQNPEKRYFGRIDYDLNSKNRLTGSVTQGDTPAFSPAQVAFAPVGTSNSDVSRLNLQVTDVYTISPRLINEARFGFTYQGNFFGDGTLGKGYPAALGWQFAKADEIPGIQFVTNYPYAWIQPSSNQFIYKENVFDPSDAVTLITGKHVLHFGGEVGVYRNDNTPYAAINPGTFQFSGQYTQHWTLDSKGVAHPDSNTGADFADFLLGDALNWNAQNAGEYGARLKNPQVFVQDDYKIRPNLTLNLGLRYQVRLGIKEVKGNVGTFDPTVINPANNTPGAYWYGVTHANGRNALETNKYTTVLPRVGFSYLPNPNMTIRGGFGIYAYNLSLDTYGGGLGNVSQFSGNYNDPTNGVIPGVILDGTGTANLTGAPLPFVSPGTSPTRFNGQNAQYTQYDTPDPEIYQYNLGVQQALGTNMVFNLSYVGSHGFHLNFPTDINQVPTALLSVNDGNSRPNQNYNQISGSTNDAISNYNSLQAEINRRLSSGLSFDFSYTWSHFLDDQDSSGFGSRAGPISRQYADAPSNYSNSNFDIRNAFKGRIVYELPVGRGRQFLNHNYLVDAILGGYQISSTMQLQSGNPFSLFATSQNTYAEPGSGNSPFVNYAGAPFAPPGGRSLREFYNPAAFSLPANGTFGNVRRNSLYGPGLEYVNISAGKKFNIYENVKLQLRIDATNAFNHPSFSNPNGNLNTGPAQQVGQPFSQTGSFNTSSQITGVTVGGRNLQGGLRLEF